MKSSPVFILGISCFYHDSAASLVLDGDIVAAAQEERFTRKKHDASFPVHAIKYCLDEAGVTIDDLEAIVFYDKPLLKFERLLETYYYFAPRGIASFIKAMPSWIREKLFIKKQMLDGLKEVMPFNKKYLKLKFSEHHLSHAASAFYPSPFDEAAILTMDGVGEWATTSICKGNGKDIEVLKEIHFPHSLGLLYSAFTYYLGFRVNSGEYKLMGLAPYANPKSDQVAKFVQIIKTELITIFNDGSYLLNQKHFKYAHGLRMVDDNKWARLFGVGKRSSESKLSQDYCDLAMAIQLVTEEVVQGLVKEAKRITGCKNICLAGGVALNCVVNGKVLKAGTFDHLFIQPASGDAGGSLGAALAYYHIALNGERHVQKKDAMKASLLGPEYVDHDVEKMLKGNKAQHRYFNQFDELTREVANLLADGNIVGWMQGRMEFGPRALGNRSILADPRNEDMQKKLNLNIKYRESFRPFAPSVLAEQAKELFDLDSDSPYMLLVSPVDESLRKEVPEDYMDLPLKEKLYVKRSSLPSITHVDFSARVQTAHQDKNEKYWKLIHSFYELTGCPLVINTSFNVRGEPIVCTPQDAFHCFMNSEMDYLVVGNYLFDKKEQKKEQKKQNEIQIIWTNLN